MILFSAAAVAVGLLVSAATPGGQAVALFHHLRRARRAPRLLDYLAQSDFLRATPIANALPPPSASRPV